MADHSHLDILDAIYAAVDEVNRLLPPGEHLARSEATPITGDGASLDSLGFLNLMMLAETRLNQRGGEQVNLAEELLDGSGGEPPRTLGDLATLVAALQGA
jgi:hypothetical protein